MKTLAQREIQCDPTNRIGRRCRDISDADLADLSERVARMAVDVMPEAADIADRIERVATHRDEVQARWNIRRIRRQIERADRLIDRPARPTTANEPEDAERWDGLS